MNEIDRFLIYACRVIGAVVAVLNLLSFVETITLGGKALAGINLAGGLMLLAASFSHQVIPKLAEAIGGTHQAA